MEVLTRQWCLDAMAGWMNTAGPPGAVVEVGVYQGGSLAALAKLLPDRQLYGYDTFRGLEERDADRDGMHRNGDFFVNEHDVRANLAPWPNVTLTAGRYPGTDRTPGPVAMAHLDVDLYRPTLAGLDHLWPRLAPGGRIYAGDAYWPSCPGATAALELFSDCQRVPLLMVRMPGARHTRYWYSPGDFEPPLVYVEKPR